jgi:hypothetical protein
MWKDLDNSVSLLQFFLIFARLARSRTLMHLQDPDANHISIHTNGAAANNAEERAPVMGGTQIGVKDNVGVPSNQLWNGKVMRSQPCCSFGRDAQWDASAS